MLRLFTDTAPDERAAERGRIRNAALLCIGLVGADDLISDGLVVLVGQRDGRAEHDAVARQRRRIDDLRARQPVLQIADRGFDLSLPFLGGVIFGIFRKVAMRARFLDRIDDEGALGLQSRELRAQLLIAFRQHRHLFNACHYPIVLRQKFRLGG